MKKDVFLTALFFLIVGIFFYLFYRLMIPFFTPIAWAGVLTIVFYPFYRWLNKKIRWPGLAALIACIVIFFVLIGPTTYLLASLASEATSALQKVNEAYQDGRLKNYLSLDIPMFKAIKDKLISYPQLADLEFESVVKDAISIVTKAIGSQATTVIANISKNLFYLCFQPL